MEWKVNTRLDIMEATDSKPTSEYEHHLVHYVIVSYVVCWYKCS